MELQKEYIQKKTLLNIKFWGINLLVFYKLSNNYLTLQKIIENFKLMRIIIQKKKASEIIGKEKSIKKTQL